MPRKKKLSIEERRQKPVGKAGIKTTHNGGWTNAYRPYCKQPGDERTPEVSPPQEVGYNESHSKKRREAPAVDPELKRINEADWRNRRLTKPDTV